MYSFITSGNFVIFKHTDDDIPFEITQEKASFYEKEVFKLHNTSKCIDWGLTIDTTRITFTIDEERYENILLSSIDFDGDVCSAQQDFIDGVQGMFDNLSGGGGLPLASGSESITEIWAGSQAEYDLLTPDSSTLYFIV